MPEIALASFNTYWGIEHRKGPYDLVGAALRFDADVIALQEVWRPDDGTCALDEIAERGGYSLVELPLAREVPRPKPSITRKGPGTWGLAVLSRFPIRAHAHLPIGSVPGDQVRERWALRAELEVENASLDVVCVHTSSKVPYGPIMHLRALRPQLVTDRAGVVAGDMNFWGPPVERLLPGWKRVVRGRTWHAKLPHSQIDHILVNKYVEGRDGEVLAYQGSDHRPIRARLRF